MKDLIIDLKRDVFNPEFTLGRMTFLGKTYPTVEDAVRQPQTPRPDYLTPEDWVGTWKIPDVTAIPTTEINPYRILWTYSGKYERNMRLINDVPGFSGIRMHSANFASQLRGCVAPGKRREPKCVGDSRKAMIEIEELLVPYALAGKLFIWIS